MSGVGEFKGLSEEEIKKFEMLSEKYADDTFKCIRCSYCQAKCPSWEEFGWVSHSARGRIQTARGIIEGKLRPSEYMLRAVFTCNMCDYCLLKCPAGLPTTDIIRALKHDLAKQGYYIEVHKKLVERVQKYGNPYGEDPKKRADWMKEV
ncbi:MAG: lactate racemase [Archaeoglobi archaeon]|nr:(Fe-S)-binding protein [Candidatus Mnemosynella bozhongmuii]MDK2781993.1 lactate racemase [Archaeoglobi archaeon]